MLFSSMLAIGFSLAAIKFKTANAVLKLLSPIPKPLFLPIVMLIFGIGEASKIVFLLLYTIFQLTSEFKSAFLGFDRETYFLYKKQGMKNPLLFFEAVFLPAVPYLFTSLCHSFSSSFAMLILIESFGTLKGLGFFMLDSFLKMKYKEMAFAVVISAVLGGFLPLVFEKVAARFWPWKSAG